MLTRILQISEQAFPAGRYLPGLAICTLLALIALGLAEFAGSGIVWALVLGIAIASTWPPRAEFLPGIAFASKHVLRFGVALLGLQISQQTLQVLSVSAIAGLSMAVLLVLVAGWLVGPRLGLSRELSLVLAASVAICGASAAAAFAAVFLKGDDSKRDLGCSIGLVSILSMAAMLVYASLPQLLGLNASATGFLLGGTIHEVAHAVAAGYAVGPEAGNVATLTKLVRVGLLAPMLFLFAASVQRGDGRAALPLPPWFLVVFVGFALLNLAGFVPAVVEVSAAYLSRFCLVLAMAAIAIVLPWRSLVSYGWRPLVLLLLLSMLLLLVVAAFVMLHAFA